MCAKAREIGTLYQSEQPIMDGESRSLWHGYILRSQQVCMRHWLPA